MGDTPSRYIGRNPRERAVVPYMKKTVMSRTGGAEVLELIDAATPTPEPGEVLVEAESIGVGWVDVMIRSGTYRWMPPLPTSPGSDMAGRIVAVGPGVDATFLGRPALVTTRELPVRGGCYAQALAVPADAVFLLPDDVDLDQAVCLPNYQVAWNLVHEIDPGRPPRSIYVSGIAGGIGSAVAQVAKAAGALVIGSVSSPQKARFALEVGADHVVDYRNEDPVARVREITAGSGVNRVVDHVGGSGFTRLLQMLGDWGTLVSYNASAGLPQDNLLQAMRDLGSRCPSVRIFEMHVYDHDRDNRRRTMRQCIDALASGRIAPVVSMRLPLRDVRRAHELIEARQTLGKIVLKPRQ